MVRGGAWFSLDLAGSSGRSYSRVKISASVYTPPHVGAMLPIDFEAVPMAEAPSLSERKNLIIH